MSFAQEAFLIGAAVSGAVTGTLAGHRNRNALLWGCLGFVFGLLALLVCVLLPRREASGMVQP
jgi:hypothetical protein